MHKVFFFYFDACTVHFVAFVTTNNFTINVTTVDITTVYFYIILYEKILP
jgi:hypothetical protein